MITQLIPLEEAARRLGLKPRTLIRYAYSGKLGIKLFRFGDMLLVEAQTDEQIQKRYPLVMAEEREAEISTGISQREAARKYGIPSPTISRWIRQGLIRVISPGRRGRPCKIVEEDVARLAEIYHAVREASPHGFKGKRMRTLVNRAKMGNGS